MKKLITFTLLSLFLCAAKGFTQQQPKQAVRIDSIANPEDLLTVLEDYQKDAVNNTYNPKMLNMLMSKAVGTYVTSEKDLSLQRLTAIVDSDEGSLYMGFNGRIPKAGLKPLKYVYSIGAKLKTKDNYAEIIDKEGKRKNETGLHFKITRLFGGGITFSNPHKEVLKKFRTQYLSKKFQDTLETFEKVKYSTKILRKSNKEGKETIVVFGDTFVITKDTIVIVKDPSPDNELEAILNYTGAECTDRKEACQEAYLGLYRKLAEAEAKFINENKLYNYLSKYWFTFNAYVPLVSKYYQLSAVAGGVAESRAFNNYNFSGSLTYLRKLSNKNTYTVSGSMSLFNNNTIMSEEIEADPDAEDTFIGDFHQGYTKSIKLEATGFFIAGNTVGLSAAVERNFSNFTATNWKVGIPFSIKNKEDEPAVNLEIQLREFYRNQIVGIKIGYVFGQPIK